MAHDLGNIYHGSISERTTFSTINRILGGDPVYDPVPVWYINYNESDSS